MQRCTFLEGQPGVAAVRAAVLHAQGSAQQALASAQARACTARSLLATSTVSRIHKKQRQLHAGCSWEQEVLDLAPAALRLPPGECELLYGRAGYLYALLFLRKHLGPSAVDPDLVNYVIYHKVYTKY